MTDDCHGLWRHLSVIGHRDRPGLAAVLIILGGPTLIVRCEKRLLAKIGDAPGPPA